MIGSAELMIQPENKIEMNDPKIADRIKDDKNENGDKFSKICKGIDLMKLESPKTSSFENSFLLVKRSI